MSSDVETHIWLAQKGQIDTIPGTPGTYDVAYPGVLYGVSNEPYLRIGRVTTAPLNERIKYGGPSERRGALIITLVVPISKEYLTVNYDHLASIIAEHFKDGTHMRYNGVCVTVTDYPHVQEGYDDRNGYWNVPISIPWRTYA